MMLVIFAGQAWLAWWAVASAPMMAAIWMGLI